MPESRRRGRVGHDEIEEDQSEETDEECYFESSSRGG